MEDDDYLLALRLQTELNRETAEIISEPSKKGWGNRHLNHDSTQSLVDPQWEFIDPTPDIRVLFLQFNDRFFWGKLLGVEVKWSPRMTSCAGVCVYQRRAGFCSVRLSLPLLKLRPRKDLVETLLHEMIHAYLFVTQNNRDRDGHGPEFHKHMNRINLEAGTRISVYHSFHDEVRLYQQHWWRCNGPCQHRPPFFGMVRRSANRAPGSYDRWWAQHEATCGGKFIKVKEPENTKSKKTDPKKKSSGPSTSTKGDIRSFFPGSSSKPMTSVRESTDMPSLGKEPSTSKFGSSAPKNDVGYPVLNSGGTHLSNPFRKPIMSNVHGFGDAITGGTLSSLRPSENPMTNNVFGFRDLNGEGKTQSKRPNHHNEKGHVLGGTAKPPFQRKGGGFGGMLANKGGGTLVVSGSSRKADNPSSSDSICDSLSSHTTSFTAFSGTGHVLGSKKSGDSNLKKPNPLQKQVHEYTNEVKLQTASHYGKRGSPDLSKDVHQKKRSLNSDVSCEGAKLGDENQLVSCPVCNQQVLVSVINSHLDDCVVNFSEAVSVRSIPKTEGKSQDVIVLSDSEDESPESPPQVDCPGCNKKVLQAVFDSHLSLCVGNSFGDDDLVPIDHDENDSNANCPICANTFPSAEMDKHLDNCASCSIQDLSGVFDEDFSDEEEDAAVGSPSMRVSESGERVYPCPCCLILIETSKMNNHLDTCVV